MGGVRRRAHRRAFAAVYCHTVLSACRQGIGRSLLVMAAMSASLPVSASETTTYTYDPLGRLVKASNAGGPRNGRETNTSFDPAGNRSAHATGVPLPFISDASIFSIVAPPAINEGQSGVFTVTRTGTAASTTTVNYMTVNGSAAAPGDFTATSGILVFRHWETVKLITIPVLDDGVTEPAEQFSVALSSPSTGSSIGTASATATINANGTPTNQPPVTVTDYATVSTCRGVTVNVIANDSDPEGNTPLVVMSATGGNGLGTVSVLNASSVRFQATSGPGNAQIVYTVRDSLNAISTGLLVVTVIDGGGCN